MRHMVVMIQGQPQLVEVVRAQAKTVWVRLKTGEVIQRHRIKHAVGEVQE